MADASSTHSDVGRHDPGCELCEAARITPWFHEDEVCWVAECEACWVPMVVWRPHGVDPGPDERQHMLDRLGAVASRAWGDYWLDDDRRSIPDHWHVHARPKGGFNGHGRPRPTPLEDPR